MKVKIALLAIAWLIARRYGSLPGLPSHRVHELDVESSRRLMEEPILDLQVCCNFSSPNATQDMAIHEGALFAS